MTNRVALDDKELDFLFEASDQGTHCIRSKFKSFVTSLCHLFKSNTKNSFEINNNFEYLRSNSTIYLIKMTHCTIFKLMIKFFVMEIIFVLNSLPILNSN